MTSRILGGSMFRPFLDRGDRDWLADGGQDTQDRLVDAFEAGPVLRPHGAPVPLVVRAKALEAGPGRCRSVSRRQPTGADVLKNVHQVHEVTLALIGQKLHELVAMPIFHAAIRAAISFWCALVSPPTWARTSLRFCGSSSRKYRSSRRSRRRAGSRSALARSARRRPFRAARPAGRAGWL